MTTTTPLSDTIAKLNDAFRTTLDPALGRVMVTCGAVPHQHELMQHVAAFDAFTPDNDPYGERDFGAFTHAGTKWVWKIDYYDLACEHGSEDPSDPAQTTRVLTITLADER
jgi:hypothetical protein